MLTFTSHPSTLPSSNLVLHNTLTMAPAPEHSKRIEEAQKLAKTDPSKAEAIYKDILSKGPGSGEAALRDYEAALMGLGEIYRDTKRPNELAELVRTSRSVLSSFAKAKTAKLGLCSFTSPFDLTLHLPSSNHLPLYVI